jgi:hypothetical protein
MATEKTNLTGNYLYRSLLNDPVWGSDFYKLKFGEGLMVLRQQESGEITGDFDMGNNYRMTLQGKLTEEQGRPHLRMTASGINNTPTAGWVYDYAGALTPIWPEAVGQISTITGSVIRTVDHGTSKAGVTATFYMTKRE